MKLLIRPISVKIVKSLTFAYKHKINKSTSDFNPGQNMFLTLFYSLLTRDTALCIILQEMISEVELDYTLLFTWLKYTFKFDKRDVVDVASFVTYLTRNGLLNLRAHLFMVFRDLAETYLNEDYFSPEKIIFEQMGELKLDRIDLKVIYLYFVCSLILHSYRTL